MALNHKQIEKDPQRITKIKPFIDQYNWKEFFHRIKKDWKKCELNNKSYARNIICVPHNTKDMHISQNIIKSMKIKQFSL